MKDPLKQFTRLREALITEKASIETRLRELNQVLGSESTQSPVPTANRTEMTLREAVIQALKARGPLKRKELAQAVVEMGYPGELKKVLNNLGPLLYGKNSPVKKRYGKYSVAELEINH